jgi:hypothetical protein
MSGLDRFLAVFGEVLEAFHWLEAEPREHGQRGIAQGGEHLWRMISVDARLVLPAGDIAHVVQPAHRGTGDRHGHRRTRHANAAAALFTDRAGSGIVAGAAVGPHRDHATWPRRFSGAALGPTVGN